MVDDGEIGQRRNGSNEIGQQDIFYRKTENIHHILGYPLAPLVNVYITMEHHHFLWVNPLFLWPFSIAILVYQRVCLDMNF